MSTSLLTHSLPGDLTVSAALRSFQDESFLVLFDSAGELRERDARYSILTADPLSVCRIENVNYGDDPFAILRDWQAQLPSVDKKMPFCGGIAGLMSYELGQAFERLPNPAAVSFQTPVLAAGLFDWALVWDHLQKTTTVYALKIAGASLTARQRIDWVLKQLATEPAATTASPNLRGDLQGHPLFDHPNVRSNFRKNDYIEAVQRVIDYIRAGDIFQANLSQQLTAPWEGSAIDLYERVRQENPAPFCGLLQADDFAIVSASPERFLKVAEHRFVETRPIKGTRRRHRSPIADLFTGNELSASEKDVAENVMIVDLLRNDISRVCQPGTVRVTGLCEIEVFETVQHLVSTIVGELNVDADIWDLCRATIPGGSITGAPKIRAMEIIADLEKTRRGAYCGNLFFLSPGGGFDSSILIRTFTLKDGDVCFPVGGGIVADSDPSGEYEETLHKAAGMLRTLGQ